MAKTFVLKVTKVTYSPNAPFMVRIPPGQWELEGQKKKFFDKETVARTYKDRLARLTVNYQLQAAALSDSQRLEAFECFSKLEVVGASLRAAVDHYMTYLEKAGKSIEVSQMVEELIANKTQDGMSLRYVTDLRNKLGRFASVFKNRKICDIASVELDEWLRKLKVNATSRDSYRRNLGVMFETARRRGYCSKNPAAELHFPKRLKGEVTILSPEQLRKLLEECLQELIPYVTICAFAGLRPSETINLDWQDIHLDTLQIEVRARHSKTRRHRLVPIQANLLAWLVPHRKSAGKVFFFRRKFRETYRNAGFEKWPLDVLRHSYGTYRLRILKSAEALALEMGNSPDVIFRHYRRPVGEDAANAYFAITPDAPEGALDAEASDSENDPLTDNVIDGNGRNAPASVNLQCSQAA